MNIGFTLKNLSAQTLWVLIWQTPLEGFTSKMFQVTHNGTELPYLGRMIKRGDPQREDYVQLEPGGSVSAEVDLSRAYDLSVPGQYTVQYKGRIHDVTTEASSIPRMRDAHRGIELSGDPITIRLLHP